MSLCYYCSARLFREKGIIFIQCGVEKENWEQAVKEILNQLDIMKKGEFTDEDFASSISALSDAYNGVEDSPIAVCAFYGSQAFDGAVSDGAEVAETIRAVTREQVIKCAKRVTVDSIYLLAEETKTMSNIIEAKNKLLCDSYYEIEHDSGLKIFVYPKADYSSSYAVFGTKYGSIDTCFCVDGQKDFISVPEGIAHFLEHKLFESEELDAFARYAKTGANANAYTSFDKTCYLFSCTDNFEESLEILLDFVSNPYFTPETVQKEQGIIGQEIKMCNDEPGWESLFSLLRAMYHNHPVKIDIAGTVQSISEITADLLYSCYDTFYNFSNMALAVAGNVTVEQVLNIADRMLKKSDSKKLERKFELEPETVVEDTVIRNLSVAMPIFTIGFKENIKTPRRSLKECVESEILLDIMAGRTSELYESLLNDGLINTTFDTEYFEGYGYSAHIFTGESFEYEKVRERINDEILRVQEFGVDEKEFERIKKKHYGGYIMNFNDIDSIANSLVGSYFNGDGMFDQLEVLGSITAEDINNRLRTAINIKNSSMSVIKEG